MSYRWVIAMCLALHAVTVLDAKCPLMDTFQAKKGSWQPIAGCPLIDKLKSKIPSVPCGGCPLLNKFKSKMPAGPAQTTVVMNTPVQGGPCPAPPCQPAQVAAQPQFQITNLAPAMKPNPPMQFHNDPCPAPPCQPARVATKPQFQKPNIAPVMNPAPPQSSPCPAPPCQPAPSAAPPRQPCAQSSPLGPSC